MSNRYFREDGDDMFVGGGGYGGGSYGGGGFGGCFALLIIGVIIFWLLFSRDRDGCGNSGGGYNMPYAPYPVYPPYAGGGNCCSPLDCKIPMTPDMSNCEVDRDLWKVDADIWKANCEVKETVKDGDQAILNKLCDQDYKRACEERDAERAKNTALESRYYTEKEVGGLKELILKMDNQNDKQIGAVVGLIKDLKCELDCNLPKRPPVYYKGSTPDTHDIDCHDYRDRRNSNDCCNSCCQ